MLLKHLRAPVALPAALLASAPTPEKKSYVFGVIAKSQYGAAKAALVGLARAWAKELAARGITVNVVSPAATDTAMLTDPDRAAIPPAELPPMGRRIRPEEVAALVAFLLSEDAAAITGQEIAICGGSSL